MSNEITGPSSYLDFDGLRQLRGSAHRGDGTALRTTARQFEALFVQSILKSMRDSVEKSDLLSSETTEMYEGLFDKELAQILAKRGVLGIGDLLARQMEPTSTPQPQQTEAGQASASRSPTAATGMPLVAPAGLPLQRESRSYPLGEARPQGMPLEPMTAARVFELRQRTTP